MQQVDENQFLDLLYEAAVDPDLWVPVMEQLADAMGGSSAWLSRTSVVDGSGPAITARIDPQTQQQYRQYYGGINPFVSSPNPEAGVVTNELWMPKEDLAQTEYYNDFLRPQDSGAFAIVRLGRDARSVSALSVNRSYARGSFERGALDLAERLRPHIRRAFKLTAKLGESALKGDDAGVALDQSPHGIFVLNDLGAVRRTNRAADRLMAQGLGLYVAHGRLGMTRADDDRRLEALIAAAAAGDPEQRCGGSMGLRTARRRGPLSVTVAPVRSERLAVFGHRPSVVVVITDPEARPAVTEAAVQNVFGLTPAEARVALAMLDGATAREAAEQLGVSFHTVRHQIQSLLDKTGASRRTELVALLARAGAAPVLP